MSIVNKEHMHPKRKFCPYTSTAFQQLSGSLRLNAVIAVTNKSHAGTRILGPVLDHLQEYDLIEGGA